MNAYRQIRSRPVDQFGPRLHIRKLPAALLPFSKFLILRAGIDDLDTGFLEFFSRFFRNLQIQILFQDPAFCHLPRVLSPMAGVDDHLSLFFIRFCRRLH